MSEIRNAKAVDIPAMLALIQSVYDRSHYAQERAVQIDVAEAKRLLVTAITRHDHRNGGGCWIQVADRGGMIVGMILATLVRVYSVGNKLTATDLFWISGAAAEPTDAANLMRGMIEWARRSPACVEIKCATMAVGSEPERSGKLLERLGLQPYGNVYRTSIERAEQCLAS